MVWRWTETDTLSVWKNTTRTEAQQCGRRGTRRKTVRYSGKERDATGLYYYGYRTGRWLSPDPAGTVNSVFERGFIE
ncbi:RHS repeat-associated core domain-containing protein [Xenorhabdus bovienii]|uniref:RHS repeat-associated core domain-containing protein n=1 Tax=Xenorhabdus bovienii TaxID=40576 RepID=UPI0036F2AB6D